MERIKNILQHELIGLECDVQESKNKDQVGIHGKIVDETMKTISIKTDKGVKKIMKKNTKFRIHINEKKILVDGSMLVSRPEDRIRKKTRKW